jgi:hypothetical protein
MGDMKERRKNNTKRARGLENGGMGRGQRESMQKKIREIWKECRNMKK